MVILIADDDRLARFQLKSMLCDMGMEDMVIYEASNGKKMVEQCRRYAPDIAFVDITMPQIDGLSAIEQCRQYASDVQFVVVSGHSDFSYARRGIALQIADYLVKPIETQQLRNVVNCVRRRLEQQRHSKNLDFSARITQSFQIWDEVGYCPQPDPCACREGRYYLFRFYLDGMLSPEDYRGAYLDLTGHLHSLGHDLARNRIPYLVWEPKEPGLDFVVYCDRDEGELLRRNMDQLCRSASSRQLQVSCLYTTGLDMWTAFCAMKDMGGKGCMRFGIGSTAPVDSQTFAQDEWKLMQAAEQLAAAFQGADEQGYDQAMFTLESLPDGTVDHLDARHLAELLSISMGGRFHWDGSLPALRRQLLRHKSKIYSAGTLERTDKISYILDYVDKHYMEDISVVQLSEKLQVTPNYFSKIFRDRVGKTFSAYIAEVRIQNARRILSTRRDVRISDVALMVGYFSPRHFANVFKKMTGCHPSEFRLQAGLSVEEDEKIETTELN